MNSPINFNTANSTIGAWLASGSAFNIVENTPNTLTALIGNPGTLVDFAGFVTVTNGETFTVTHDDGLSLIIGGTDLGFNPGPTSPVTTTATYTGPSGTFPFQLVYAEGHGGPAVLQVDLPLVNPEIALDPATATNPAGTSHTVTATITAAGAPLPGELVKFTVTSGPNAGASGTCSANTNCTTDAAGNVSWTYTGGASAGTDIITACFTDVTGTERCARAEKTWSNGPDLTITKAPKPGQAKPVPGGTFSYIIRVTNVGNRPTPPPPVDVMLRDRLPAGTSLVFWTASGGVCTNNSPYVDCFRGRMAPGEVWWVEISVRLPRTPGTITNVAVVDPFNRIAEINEANNSASLTTTFP